jgi:hypothetical protein
MMSGGQQRVHVRHAHQSCLSRDERHGWLEEEGVSLEGVQQN